MEAGLATAPNSAVPFARPRKAHDASVKAAGLMIVTPDNCALFLKRGEGDHEGEWCFPAGGANGDEDPLTTAVRETREETGWTAPEGSAEPKKIDSRVSDGVDFTTFRLNVNNPFIPTLDDEHVGWAWAPLDEPPEPLHPGVKATLAGDDAAESGASRALLRNTIKYPPPKANDDERAIDLSFKRGGAGKTLKESPAARKNNLTTRDLAPGQISSSEMSRFRTMPARRQSEVISLLERIKKLKGRDPTKAAELQKQVDRLAGDDWKESDHPRGQPGNAGQFGPGGVGGEKAEAGKGSKAAPPKLEEDHGDKPLDLNKEYKVVRLDRGDKDTLGNVNAGNVRAVADHLVRTFDPDAPSFSGGHGNVISIYGVKFAKQPEDYKVQVGKSAKIEALGRRVQKGAVSYSFPDNGKDFESQIVTKIPLEKVIERLKSKGYDTPDDAGINETANAINALIDESSNKNEAADPMTAAKIFTEKYPNVADPSKLSQGEVDERVSYADNIAKELAKNETNKIDTPERHALRKKLIDEIYSKGENTRQRNRDATIILGLPAAGKSTVANPIIEEKGALEVDPDIAKGMLPEFANGLGAAATHEESSDITKEVLKRALTNGDNIVWPRVDSPDKIIRDLKMLKSMGYKVNLRHLEVTPELATKSAIGRFLKRGRYVPLSLISEFGTQPLDAYKKAKEFADSSEAFERTDAGINKAPHL